MKGEVDGKLIDDLKAKSTIIEALGFVEQAHKAVSQTQQRVEVLQRARNDSVKRKSA